MAVVVDKPGRDDTARGVDRPRSRTAQFADFDDLSVFDRDIAAESRHPRAIDDAAVADQQIIRHHYPFRCSGHGSSHLRQSLARRIGATRTAKLTARSSVLAWLECRGTSTVLLPVSLTAFAARQLTASVVVGPAAAEAGHA